MFIRVFLGDFFLVNFLVFGSITLRLFVGLNTGLIPFILILTNQLSFTLFILFSTLNFLIILFLHILVHYILLTTKGYILSGHFESICYKILQKSFIIIYLGILIFTILLFYKNDSNLIKIK